MQATPSATPATHLCALLQRRPSAQLASVQSSPTPAKGLQVPHAADVLSVLAARSQFPDEHCRVLAHGAPSASVPLKAHSAGVDGSSHA